MKASWTETQEIENHMLSQSTTEQEQFRIRMLCDASFYDKVVWQQATYTYIHLYGQEVLKQEIALAERAVFELPIYERFRKTIKQIFS